MYACTYQQFTPRGKLIPSKMYGWIERGYNQPQFSWDQQCYGGEMARGEGWAIHQLLRAERGRKEMSQLV